MSKELIYKKGILIEVISWENDGDHYNTQEYSVSTIEEAKGIKRMCEILFKSEHSGDLAIANDCGASISDYEDEILEFMSNDKWFNTVHESNVISVVEDLAYQLMGSSEDYNCRVCESCTIYNIKEDVYLDKVEL